jgi:hypothetical protein
MATVINGILSQKLPWGLVLLGVFLVIAVELLGIRSLILRRRRLSLHRHHAGHLRRRHGALPGRRSFKKAGAIPPTKAKSAPAHSTPQA